VADLGWDEKGYTYNSKAKPLSHKFAGGFLWDMMCCVMKGKSLMEPLCGVVWDMNEDRLKEEVGRLFLEKMEFVLSQPVILLRILNACVSNSDILVRKREEWGIYLDGLVEHGVRREGRISFMVVGVGSDEIAVDDPLSDSSVIIVPREFGLRMVVLGGLP
jgi:hypothetical protein